MQLRKATPSDLPTILEIFNHAIIHTTAVYSYDCYTPEMMLEWYNEKMENDLPLFVSIENDLVTGFVTYGKFRARPAYKYTMEHSIYVHPKHRKKGIAKGLMEHIIAIAQLNNIHSLIGGIDAANDISINFHKRYGFKEVGYLKEVGYKFDKWLDLKFMQLILNTPKSPNNN